MSRLASALARWREIHPVVPVAIVALLLAGLLNALGPQPGALDMSGGAAVCGPGAPGEVLLIAGDLRVPDDRDVVAGRIELLEPNDIRLVDAWLYPDFGEGGIGVVKYPPDMDFPGWDQRIHPDGGHLPAGSKWWVVVAVTPVSSRPATAAAFGLWYRDFGTTFRGVTGPEITIAKRCF